MATYTTQNGAILEFDGDDDRRFFAVQALLSQGFLAVADKYGELHDEEDNVEMRHTAVDEWSGAVRNGFICC